MWGKFEICTMKYIQIVQQSSLKMHNEIVKKCTAKLSKNAQRNCQKLHNETVKNCTINIEKNKKICYHIGRGEFDEINKKWLYTKINR